MNPPTVTVIDSQRPFEVAHDVEFGPICFDAPMFCVASTKPEIHTHFPKETPAGAIVVARMVAGYPVGFHCVFDGRTPQQLWDAGLLPIGTCARDDDGNPEFVWMVFSVKYDQGIVSAIDHRIVQQEMREDAERLERALYAFLDAGGRMDEITLVKHAYGGIVSTADR